MENWEACGKHVLIIRDDEVFKRGGLDIPDSALKKATSGIIISCGSEVVDEKIRADKKALFNKTAGFEIEFPEGDLITVLQSQDVIATKWNQPRTAL